VSLLRLGVPGQERPQLFRVGRLREEHVEARVEGRLPRPGQKVFFTTGPIIYRASFQPWHVRPSDEGLAWLSISGLRVTHWMPARERPDGVPSS
jgi:hypothetical protein